MKYTIQSIDIDKEIEENLKNLKNNAHKKTQI